jgi:hypothetical protein
MQATTVVEIPVALGCGSQRCVIPIVVSLVKRNVAAEESSIMKEGGSVA